MQGREFLDLAGEVVRGGTEVHYRGAIIHAYYALILECRDAFLRWGFTIPRRENLHSYVRLRFSYAGDADVKSLGTILEDLGRARNAASYNLATLSIFQDATAPQQAIQDASDAFALLDQIDGDPTRQAAAIASIRP